MTVAVVELRAGCTALRHDTASAYKKNGCRCPKARALEVARKAKYDINRKGRATRTDAESMIALVKGGVPPFANDPARRCADLPDPDLMFAEREGLQEKAKQICRPCPFREQCAAWALEHRQVYGVWGAISADERRRQIAALHGRPATLTNSDKCRQAPRSSSQHTVERGVEA